MNTFCYADPVYLGCCSYYGHNHGSGASRPFDGGCWNNIETHALLIEWLSGRFRGFALSMSSSNIQALSPLLPKGVHWGSWVKPFGSFKPGISPAYVWEPVAFYVPNRPKHDRGVPTVRDFLIEEGPAIRESIALKKGLTGAKPPKFCEWVLDVLGWTVEDELVDLFPGTGVMGRVVEQRRARVNNEPLRLLP